MRSSSGLAAPVLRALPIILAAVLTGGCATTTNPSLLSRTDGAAPTGSAPTSVNRPLLPATSRPPSPSSAPTSSTVATIARLQAEVIADPTDADAQRSLGFALLQRVRETADPSLYSPALTAFEAALRFRPDDATAMTGIAAIQLGKHEFADGLVTARKAIALSPSLVAAHAAEVDALVELGRYDEADDAAGRMFGLNADLSTLARVSYLAELRGHLPTAVAAMRQAARSPGLAPENTAYVDALLGNLLVYTGDPASAADAYTSALELVADHAPSLAGQGRLAVASGQLDEAIDRFERAAAVVPLPEYVIALGDAQTAAGRIADATKSYNLARAEIRLFQAAGVVVDVDLALLEADHGDPTDALRHAKAAYAVTPTIRAADAVAWALHRLGRDREAATYVRRALRLGTIDPILRYHAGAIEAALADVTAAQRDLRLAIATDPGFSATGVREARRLLASLAG
jgi:tetratricopeptide (TPR) repeat protein